MNWDDLKYGTYLFGLRYPIGETLLVIIFAVMVGILWVFYFPVPNTARDEDLADMREFQECQRQCRAMNDRRLTAWVAATDKEGRICQCCR